MDFVHTLLNFVAPFATLSALFFITPLYCLFKILSYLHRSLSKEDVAGKVVLIAGASSGIGEHLSYEYARRGACLVVAARREKSLREVAHTARLLGAPEAIAIPTDVSDIHDCKRLIHQTIDHFGRCIKSSGELCWGDSNVHARRGNRYYKFHINHGHKLLGLRYLSLPYLRKSKGKIIVIASSSSWMTAPKMTFYNASKAAVVSFYESLRIELGSDVGITIVTPGLTESEMSKGKIINKDGEMVVDQDIRDAAMSIMPVELAATSAVAIVDGALRGDVHMSEPTTMVYWVAFLPEMVEWLTRWFCLVKLGASPLDAPRKKLLDVPGLRQMAQPESIQSPEIKEG